MPEGGQALQPAITADGRGLIVPEGSDNPGVVRMDAATGEVVWATRDLGRVAPGASPWVGNGGLRADGRYVVTTDSHVLTLDPDTGAILDATAWPEPMPYSDLFRVWPDGRVSREDPEQAATGILFDPSHPERGATEIDGIPLSDLAGRLSRAAPRQHRLGHRPAGGVDSVSGHIRRRGCG